MANFSLAPCWEHFLFSSSVASLWRFVNCINWVSAVVYTSRKLCLRLGWNRSKANWKKLNLMQETCNPRTFLPSPLLAAIKASCSLSDLKENTMLRLKGERHRQPAALMQKSCLSSNRRQWMNEFRSPWIQISSSTSSSNKQRLCRAKGTEICLYR